MDDVMEEIVNFHVADTPNITTAPHPKFAGYYKPKISSFDQEERRAALLLAQKMRREAVLESRRHISEADEEDESGDQDDEELEMIVEPSPQLSLVEKGHKRFRTWISADDLRDKLMYSEWLVDVPGNLRSDWLFVMCPQGYRCLVVAADGKTEVFSTKGSSLKSFVSLLPGGNIGTKDSMTILDCIADGRVFHVLDALCWNRLSLLDYETATRIDILKTQIAAEPELSNSSTRNPYRFLSLPFFPVTELEERLKAPLPFEGELDGVLFYHKRTVYTHGYTPLVGWLKAHMLPKMLNVRVPDALLKGNELLLWQPNRGLPDSSNFLSLPQDISSSSPLITPKPVEVMEIVEIPVDADFGGLPVITNTSVDDL